MISAPSATAVGGLIGGVGRLDEQRGYIGNVCRATIEDCYSVAEVLASDYAGGLVGAVTQNADKAFSNLVMSRCYAASKIACAGACVGSVVGLTSSGATCESLFVDTDATAPRAICGGVAEYQVIGYPNPGENVVGEDLVSAQVQGVATAELSTRAFLAKIGSAFKAAFLPENGGRPALAWEKTPGCEFEISYVLDGGTNAEANPATFVSGTSVALAAPSKDGFDFDGWYADAGFSAKVERIGVEVCNDVVLYAKWVKREEPSPEPSPEPEPDPSPEPSPEPGPDPAPGPTFTDVDPAQWYGPSVEFVAAKGLMTGYAGTDLFGVGKTLTRGEFATILWRHACPDEAASYDMTTARNETGIAGVADGAFYTAAANWAVRAGIITGYTFDDGTADFAADDPVTFEQMITIMARMCADPDELVGQRADLSRFLDGDAASCWAVPSLVWATVSGLVKGYDVEGGKNLSPIEKVFRERTATVLQRAFTLGLL